MSLLTESIKKFSESATNMRKNIKDSFDNDHGKFAEMILSLIEANDLETINYIADILGNRVYLSPAHVDILKICLKELPWKFCRIYSLYVEIYGSRDLYQLRKIFRQVLNSDDVKDKKVEYVSHLIEKKCWIYSDSHLLELFSANVVACMKNTTILNEVINTLLSRHDLYPTSFNLILKIFLEDYSDNPSVIEFFRKLSTGKFQRWKTMMWFCRDHEDLTIIKFKELGLISEDDEQNIRDVMHIKDYPSYDYRYCNYSYFQHRQRSINFIKYRY